MRHNFAIVLAAAAMASGVAGSATAWDNRSDISVPLPNPPGQHGGLFAEPSTPADSLANLQESYDLSIMMLKKKMQRLTREDGGQLSAAHQASLQADLDRVNRRYHAGRFAQR
jgi:hypothetical protein